VNYTSVPGNVTKRLKAIPGFDSFDRTKCKVWRISVQQFAVLDGRQKLDFQQAPQNQWVMVVPVLAL
jgi:hypothetical protein